MNEETREIDIRQVDDDLDFLARIKEVEKYPAKLHQVIVEEFCKRLKEDLRRLY